MTEDGTKIRYFESVRSAAEKRDDFSFGKDEAITICRDSGSRLPDQWFLRRVRFRPGGPIAVIGYLCWDGEWRPLSEAFDDWR